MEMIDHSNMSTLRGIIIGAEDTPYSGGRYELEIKIDDSYPFQPPKVKFITPIWHPNVSSVTGAICLDVLKDRWAAALTIRTVLVSIQALMSKPVPDDPQDAVVAKQYKSNLQMWNKVASYWTYKYANPCNTLTASPLQLEWDNKICLLKNTVTQHTSDHKIVAALSQHNFDGDAAYLHVEDNFM